MTQVFVSEIKLFPGGNRAEVMLSNGQTLGGVISIVAQTDLESISSAILEVRLKK